MTGSREPTGTVATDAAPQPGFWARVAAALRLLVPLLAVPLLIGMTLGGRNAAMGATLGAFGSFMIAAGAGWRRALWIMPIAIVMSGFAGLAYGGPWWVAILTAAGAACGVAARWGLLPQAALVGVLIAVAPAMAVPGELVQYVVFGGLGTAAGIVLAQRAGIPDRRTVEPVTASRAATYTVFVGLTVAASALIAASWDSEHDYWLPLIVFLLVTPSAELSLRQRAQARLLGTILGAAVSVVLIPLNLPVAVDLLAGFAFLVLAFVYPRPMWLNSAFTAAAILLMLTAGSQEEGALASLDRITATVVGALLLLAATAAAALLSRLVSPTAEEQEVAQLYRPPGADAAR